MSAITCSQIEVTLTGYVDHELTQQEVQRVELHLETCSACRQIVEELQTARSLARELNLPQPSHEEWEVMQSRILETTTRNAGWILLSVWAAVTVAYGLISFAFSPSESLLLKIAVFGLLLALALLFCSVLVERLRERKNDRYTGVQQ